MNFDFLKNPKVLSFAAGAAAVICGKKIAQCPKTREVCVSGVAKGMQLYKDAKAAAINIKEDAEDICREAKASIDKEEE